MTDNPLNQVLTIREVAEMWCFARETVWQAMGAREKPLDARKSYGTWLISYASCVRRWGEPIKKLRDYRYEMPEMSIILRKTL